MKRNRSVRGSGGFSLVELSVLLTLIALMAVGALSAMQAGRAQRNMDESRSELETVAEVLEKFYEKNGRLPCPAGRAYAYGAAAYGREVGSCASAVSGQTAESTMPSTRKAAIGMVPVYTLGLPEEYAADGWDRRYRYTVDSSLADTNTANVAASIASSVERLRVEDGSGGLADADDDEAHFVLTGFGANGLGGYDRSGGTLFMACDTALAEGENCDSDYTFVKRIQSLGDDAYYFDDFLVWRKLTPLP